MTSFQSKISWRRPRKGDHENYSSDPFLPTRPIIENSKKIATKFINVINTHMASFQAKIVGEGCEREKIKINALFRSCSTRNRKFQKNNIKIEKIRK